MNETFITYKVFPDPGTARDIAEILNQHDIAFLIEEDALVFDPSYANNELNKDYRLKIRPKDFDRANQVLDEYYRLELDRVEKDHYLFEFSDDELHGIIEKPDEWGHLDYQLAKKILADRGKEVKPEEAEDLKNKRMKELATPQTVSGGMIVWGYIVCLLFFPVGLFIGWNWGYSKKTLPNGSRIYDYDARTIKHGRRIVLIGIIMFIWLVGRLLSGVFLEMN
jgi:hypothetical protein